MKAEDMSRQMKEIEAFRGATIPEGKIAIVRAMRNYVYGYDDPILVDENGFVSESSVSQNETSVGCLESVVQDCASPLAYYFGSEFSFVIPRVSQKYTRRAEYLASWIASMLTLAASSYAGRQSYFTARVYLADDAEHIEDYFRWRKAECEVHGINTIYRSVLSRQGLSEKEAERVIQTRTISDRKAGIRASGINFANIPSWLLNGTFSFDVATPYFGFNPMNGEYHSVMRPRSVLSSMVYDGEEIGNIISLLELQGERVITLGGAKRGIELLDG